MSLHEPLNTMAGQLGRAVYVPRLIANAPVSHVANLILGWGGKDEKPSPETAAAEFYLLEHAIGILRRRKAGYERLTDAEVGVFETYHRTIADLAVRNYFYLLLICYREMRHCGDKDEMVKAASVLHQISFTPLNNLFAAARDEANVHTVCAPMVTHGHISVGEFAKALSYGFHNGKFNAQFGGHPWGNIADVVVEFVYGRSSAVHMIDMAWALEHNGGCAYNKNFLFACHGGNLLEVLDVQRAGMIPHAVAAAKNGAQFNSAKHFKQLADLHTQLRGVVGEDFEANEIDWKAVVKAGAVGDYAKYGAPKIAKYAPKPKASVVPAHAKPEGQSPVLSMWPNFSVPVQTKGPRHAKAAT